MSSTREQPQHTHGILAIDRFTQDLTIDDDRRIRRENGSNR
jgi:hypothetical protein